MTIMEDVSKQQQNFILFLNLDMVRRNSTPGGFAYTWQSTRNWEGIFEMKTKTMQFTWCFPYKDLKGLVVCVEICVHEAV